VFDKAAGRLLGPWRAFTVLAPCRMQGVGFCRPPGQARECRPIRVPASGPRWMSCWMHLADHERFRASGSEFAANRNRRPLWVTTRWMPSSITVRGHPKRSIQEATSTRLMPNLVNRPDPRLIALDRGQPLLCGQRTIPGGNVCHNDEDTTTSASRPPSFTFRRFGEDVVYYCRQAVVRTISTASRGCIPPLQSDRRKR